MLFYHFVQTYLKTITTDQVTPFSTNNTESDKLLLLAKRRKKIVLSIMEKMDILFVTKAQNELKQKGKDTDRGNNHNKKSKNNSNNNNDDEDDYFD